MDNTLNTLEMTTAIALGLGLAAAVGFRVFVPFLLVSLAARTGLIPLAGGFEWLNSDVALVMFGAAAILEIIAYLVPYFDHLLDAVAGPAAVAAGTVLMASSLIEMEPWLRWSVALVAGGGTAGLFHGSLAGLRVGSTATTGGVANPLFATLETGGAAVLTLLALILPVAAVVLIIFLLVRVLGKLGRGLRRLR